MNCAALCKMTLGSLFKPRKRKFFFLFASAYRRELSTVNVLGASAGLKLLGREVRWTQEGAGVTVSGRGEFLLVLGLRCCAQCRKTRVPTPPLLTATVLKHCAGLTC